MSLESKIRSSHRLRRIVEPLFYWSTAFGMNPLMFCRAAMALPGVLRDYLTFRRQNKDAAHSFKVRLRAPCLADRYAESGSASGHYFHQDLYVAQRIFERKPERHVDVGSRVDGFVAHVASFRQIDVFDIRPLNTNADGMLFTQCDLMDPHEELHGCCDSLSCLHTLEHFGLGRYTDPIDVDGYVKGFENLAKIVKSGGDFYLSVPIGPERVDFNGHRCFSVKTILDLAVEGFSLRAFSYVDDSGTIHPSIDLTEEMIESNCGCYYGCGIFEFQKK